MRDIVRNDFSINFHLSKLSIAKFSILYDIISGESLNEKIVSELFCFCRCQHYQAVAVALHLSCSSLLCPVDFSKKFHHWRSNGSDASSCTAWSRFLDSS